MAPYKNLDTLSEKDMYPSTLINPQENAPDMSISQSDGGSSSADIPSSQVTLGLCQVDKNQPA